MAAKRPKQAKLVTNPRLREYVEQRLAGKVSRPDSTVVTGPQPPRLTGRNEPHRKDRAWVLGWSPEQISNRLKLDFPDDESMRISHEAIYQSLFIEARGALKKELAWCLRTTRFTMLVHLPREEDYQFRASIKNSPALAGYGAITMKNALAGQMSTLSRALARSVTWGRGKEMSAHALFKVETGIPVYFADPVSPWQRGTNENANGLLRQYFPKGTDLSRWSADDIDAVAHPLNSRPRKPLGWKTPAEAVYDHLQSAQETGVATTG